MEVPTLARDARRCIESNQVSVFGLLGISCARPIRSAASDLNQEQHVVPGTDSTLTQQKGECMPKRTAKIDMQRSYRGNIQTINGCICRKRRSNLTCGARFTQTNALGSQLNGSVHLDPAGIILDGGIKPVGWSFDSPMHCRHRRKIRRSSST